MRLSAGFMGLFYGYEHAGHSWTTEWQKKENLDPVEFARARYVPLGEPYYIVSRDGLARWYNAALIGNCTLYETYFFGRLIEATTDIRIEQNLGQVVECGSGSGPVAPSYNLLAAPPGTSTDVLSWSCSGGSAGSGGGGPVPVQRCTTTQTDYYWYYPDTGQLEYRYSETTTSCIEMT